MTGDFVFVSYSRKEFYFTESLVLHLQQQGINAWFDVQQLEPGIGWKSDIQDGLERCKALVLVASQSSLASPYVKIEFESALKAGKPVYVVLFEPVTLPTELTQPAAMIDFTQGFDRGISLLTTVIRDRSSHHDSQPSPQALYVPAGVATLTKLLWQREMLWLIMLVGFLIALLRPLVFFFSGEYQADRNYGAVMIFAQLMLIWVLIDLIGFRHVFRLASKIRRRENIRFRLWVKAIDFNLVSSFSFIFLITAFILVFRNYIFVLLFIPVAYLVIRIARKMTHVNRIQALLHPDVLRWCHLGNDVPFDWRLMVNQSVLPEDMEVEVQSKIVKSEDDQGFVSTSEVVTGVVLSVKGAKATPRTFRLHSTSQIKAVADEIRSIARKNQFHELTDQAAEPNYHILLLSPWTPIKAAQQLLHDYPANTLPVLVSPADLSSLAHVTTLQLIDFRRRYEPVLASALQYLHTQNVRQRSVFSIGILPVRVSAEFHLREISPLSRLLVYAATFCFLVGGLGLLSLLTRPAVDLGFGLSLIASIACLGLGFQLRKRDRDVRNLVPGMGRQIRQLTGGIVLILGGMFLFELQPKLPQNAFLDIWWGNDPAWRLAVVAFILTLGIILFLIVERMTRQGILLKENQPLLGIPAAKPRSMMLYLRNILGMLIGAILAYAIVTAVQGNMAGQLQSLSQLFRNGSMLIIVVITGAVIALLTLGITVSPLFSSDDPVFAIGDAPALRGFLRSSLRQNPSSPDPKATASQET